MLSSLSDNTYKQYDVCVKAWIQYCKINHYDHLISSVPVVIDFLSDIFYKGAKYGTINAYRSALSILLGSNILNDDRVKRFMKGVYRLRPSLPRYNITWDPAIVLEHLALKWPHESLSLETLSKKTITLLALVTAHRVQTFLLIRTINISIYNRNEIIIKIPDLIKTSGPHSFQPVLKLPYFNERPEICPATCLENYIHTTSSLRSSSNDFLFISHRKPHAKISSQRLSHWIKDTLSSSGIDTNIFSAHSTRHAATSRANRLGVNIDVIRKTAGWTQDSCVFARFYNKEIVHNTNQFARSILNCSVNQ